MKKGLLSGLFLILIGSSPLFGQINKSFGFKGGTSIANQTFVYTPIDYTVDTDVIFGPVIALFYETMRGEHLSFQTDLLYTVKGSKTSSGLVTIDHLDNDKIVISESDLSKSMFRYVSISPMVRYRLEKGKKTIYVLLGPRLDILAGYSTDSPYPLEQQNKSILGLTGAVGLEYKFTQFESFVEIDYMPDLSPVTNIEPLLINNNSISLNAGLRFGL